MSRNDIRFRLIFHGNRTPSHMAFHRFIKNNLAGNVEILLSKLNLYMAGTLPEDINPENEEIDGTKEEADANKMTFVWRKARVIKRSAVILLNYLQSQFDEHSIKDSDLQQKSGSFSDFGTGYLIPLENNF